MNVICVDRVDLNEFSDHIVCIWESTLNGADPDKPLLESGQIYAASDDTKVEIFAFEGEEHVGIIYSIGFDNRDVY